MPEKIDLSLVLACYNDAEYLEESVAEIFKVFDMTRLTYEIIFVYDCGTDNSLEVIDRIISKYHDKKHIKKIVHRQNEGRGKSVRDGFNVAEGRVIGYIDVDLDVHPRHIPYMYSTIVDDGYDVATAFRYYKVTLSPIFIMRHIFSHGYRFLSRVLLHEKLMDSESGYKFFNKEKIMPLIEISHYNGWFWDTEIMAYCIYGGYKIKEITCVFDRRGDKKSSVRIIDTVLAYLKALIEFKLYLLKHEKELFKKIKKC